MSDYFAVKVFEVCVVSDPCGGARPYQPPPHSPKGWGGHQGPSVCQERGKQGGIDGPGLNSAHLDNTQQEAQCDRIPPLLYEIKRTFITVPDSPFTSKSPPRGATRIRSLSVRCWKTHLFVSFGRLFPLLKSESGWQRGGCSSGRRAYSD